MKSCFDSCAIISWRENDTLVSCRKCDQARRVKIIRICMGIAITNTQKDINLHAKVLNKNAVLYCPGDFAFCAVISVIYRDSCDFQASWVVIST